MRTRIRNSIPWLFLVLALLVSRVGNTLYWMVETTPPEFIGVLGAVTPGAALWYWFWRYLRQHQVAVPFDIGLFLGMAPFIVIPAYVLHTERGRGLFPLVGLAAVYLGAHLFVWALFSVTMALSN